MDSATGMEKENITRGLAVVLERFLYDTTFWMSAVVNGRHLPQAGVSVPNMEARTEQPFPGQYQCVLSILPRLSTSASSYLRGEKPESGASLGAEVKRNKTNRIAAEGSNGHVVGRTWRELITN